jgi:hypothetical protein
MFTANTANGVQLLGVVTVRIGNAVHTLPIQAVQMTPDAHEGAMGGLFEDDGNFGIMVRAHEDANEVQKQVKTAVDEAVRILSQRTMH